MSEAADLTELSAHVRKLERTHGPLALETTQARHDLAGALHRAGRLADAALQYDLACQGLARRFGSGHPYVLVGLNNLGLVLRDQGRHHEALGLLTAVHTRRAALWGPAHPLTLNAAHNALTVMTALGDWEGAARELPALADLCEQAFGPDDPRTRMTRRDAARALDRAGRRTEALRMTQRMPVLPVSAVLLGCARVLRWTGLFPLILTASRHGAELTLGRHPGDRAAALPAGDGVHDEDLGIRARIVGPRNPDAPYADDQDLRETCDRVTGALGALAEHLAAVEQALGAARVRVQVRVHHPRWPRPSTTPMIALDRRLMTARHRARHDRLLKDLPHQRVKVVDAPGPPRRRLGAADGWTVVFPESPAIMVSTHIGVEDRPTPSPFEA